MWLGQPPGRSSLATQAAWRRIRLRSGSAPAATLLGTEHERARRAHDCTVVKEQRRPRLIRVTRRWHVFGGPASRRAGAGRASTPHHWRLERIAMSGSQI
jgi:hypothetical protein